MFLLIESILTLVAIVVALILPDRCWRWSDAWERAFVSFANRRTLSLISVGLAALAIRVALLPILPVPHPVYHDDFCYLLEGDTFAHGRLTNPVHPMWVHFETLDIIPRPSRQCVCSPAQGVALAGGQLLFGSPFWGVWLSLGIMCAAICWMLQGWMSPPWALVGGLVVILRYSTFGYWANTYWGGAVGAIGGALALGALPRIQRSHRAKDALLMGLGLVIMAFSRPYEGFVLALPIALALFLWILKTQQAGRSLIIRRVFLPMCMLLATGAAALGYYNWRVTGSPLRMPYHVVQETYGVAPYFIWQPLIPVHEYNHQVMRDVYVSYGPANYALSRTPAGVLAKWADIWSFFVGPVFTLTSLMLLFALPYDFSWKDISNPTRFLLFTFGFSLIAVALGTYYSPHYSGPQTSLYIVLMLLPLRRLRNWQWGTRRSGVFLTRAVVGICVAMFVLRAAARPLGVPVSEDGAPAWYAEPLKSAGRPAILEHLESLPGRHLVIVRYKLARTAFEEWVYNEADIDKARVIWAREMSPAENQELIRYFRDRKVWLVEADEKPPRLSPFQQSADLP